MGKEAWHRSGDPACKVLHITVRSPEQPVDHGHEYLLNRWEVYNSNPGKAPHALEAEATESFLIWDEKVKYSQKQ